MSSPGKDAELSTFRLMAVEGLDLSSRHVTVIVGQGEDARSGYVHENLLVQHSEFFVAALRMGWREAGERTVRLPDDEPEQFEMFARFLYTGKVFSSVAGDKTFESDSINDKEWGRLGRCWIFGDKLSSTTFKDAICDAFCDKIRCMRGWPTSLHQTIYPSSSKTAPI